MRTLLEKTAKNRGPIKVLAKILQQYNLGTR